MRQTVASWGQQQILRVALSGALALPFASSSSALAQGGGGEAIDVRSGFTRVLVAKETLRPQAEDVTVTWKGAPQRVREILGGPDSSIEVGVAIDRSVSMQKSLESMKGALAEFVRSELSTADRVFVVSFGDHVEFVAEGLEASLGAIATMSSDYRPGDRPTRFFDGVERALSHFGNSAARAVLLVASDGCDSLQQPQAGQRLLRRAAAQAIPIVLIAPGRRECRNTTCRLTGPDQWSCSESGSPLETVRVQERDPRNPTAGAIDLPVRSLTSRASISRDKFVGLLKAGGGAFLLGRSESEWSRGIDAVRSLLARQWTVVFEPSSASVRSSEVKVKVRERSLPAASRERAQEVRREAENIVAPEPAAPSSVPSARDLEAVQEQIGVEVVNVDVLATDKPGHRILDLSRGDFRLEVDGKVRPIDYFSPPRGVERGSEELHPVPSQRSSPASGGKVFLVFDRATLEARTLKQLIGSFGALVSAPSFAGRTFVVASFADAPMLHTPGTSDRGEVLHALDGVLRAGASGTLRRLERRQMKDEVLSANRGNVDLIVSQILAIESQEISRQAAFVAMIRDLVTSGADAAEPNTLLIATEGFSAEPERYLRDLLSSVTGRYESMLLSDAGAPLSNGVSVLADLERLAKTLQERRVATYTLHPLPGFSDLASPEMRTSGKFRGAAPREDESLAESAANAASLADATGGSKIAISTDLKKRIESIGLDGGASYSLGFTTGPEAGFDAHEIHVATTRPGTSLRYRTSFRRRSVPEERQAALAAAARSGIVAGAFPVELESTPMAPERDGEGGRIFVTVRIPLAQLEFQPSLEGASDKAVLTVQLAVSDATGTLTPGPEEILEIFVPHTELDEARAGSWSHRNEVELPAGRAGIGALVIEKSSGAWATSSLQLSGGD